MSEAGTAQLTDQPIQTAELQSQAPSANQPIPVEKAGGLFGKVMNAVGERRRENDFVASVLENSPAPPEDYEVGLVAPAKGALETQNNDYQAKQQKKEAESKLKPLWQARERSGLDNPDSDSRVQQEVAKLAMAGDREDDLNSQIGKGKKAEEDLAARKKDGKEIKKPEQLQSRMEALRRMQYNLENVHEAQLAVGLRDENAREILTVGVNERVEEKVQTLQALQSTASNVGALKGQSSELVRSISGQVPWAMVGENETVEDVVKKFVQPEVDRRSKHEVAFKSEDELFASDNVERVFNKLTGDLEGVKLAFEQQGLNFPVNYEDRLMEGMGVVKTTPEGGGDAVYTLTEDSPLRNYIEKDHVLEVAQDYLKKNYEELMGEDGAEGDNGYAELVFEAANYKVIAEEQVRMARTLAADQGMLSIAEIAKETAGIQGNGEMESKLAEWIQNRGGEIEERGKVVGGWLKDVGNRIRERFGDKFKLDKESAKKMAKYLGIGLLALLAILVVGTLVTVSSVSGMMGGGR